LFRNSLIPAALWAAGLAPLFAWLTPIFWRNQPVADLLAVGAIYYPICALITFVGILLVAYPLTFLGERIGRGQRLPIVFLNGAVALVGFYLAATADWPMTETQQVFWLHLGFAAIIFTARYLWADRNVDSEPVASAAAP